MHATFYFILLGLKIQTAHCTKKEKDKLCEAFYSKSTSSTKIMIHNEKGFGGPTDQLLS
jgi:hypothetical protein